MTPVASLGTAVRHARTFTDRLAAVRCEARPAALAKGAFAAVRAYAHQSLTADADPTMVAVKSVVRNVLKRSKVMSHSDKRDTRGFTT